MPDPYFEQPSFQEEQKRGREVMAEQEKEIAAAKAEAAAKKEAQSEEEIAAEYQEQILIERQQVAAMAASANAAPMDKPNVPGPELAQLAELDKKIADLEKANSSAYFNIYLFLTVGAATVDTLQAAADFSAILSILAPGMGLGFSVIRHYGLKLANPRATAAEKNQVLRRTLISGAISMIPFVDLLPEQTMFMLREFTIKKEALAGIREEIRKLKAQRVKLARTLLN